MTTTTLKQAVAAILYDTYTTPAGVQIKGQSISFVKTEMRSKGFRVTRDFEDQLLRAGFITVTAKNNRGQTAQVVTPQITAVLKQIDDVNPFVPGDKLHKVWALYLGGDDFFGSYSSKASAISDAHRYQLKLVRA